MSSARAGLIQDVLDHPDEDGPRLVFADYLEDDGEAEYARFIRTQVELARVAEYDPLWVRCWFTDRDAITGRRFQESRPQLPEGVTWDLRSFERGFPARVEVRDVAVFVAHAPALFAVAPIQALSLQAEYKAPPPNLSALTDSPHLARLRRLSFSLSRLPEAEVRRLQESPHAANLTDLEFEFAGIDPGAVGALFRPPLITRLTRLRLDSNGIPWRALAQALRGAGGPHSLRSLTLSETPTPRAGRSGMFDAPLLRGLAELDLAGSELGPAGVEALAASAVPAGLESLGLTKAMPGVVGVRALAGCASLSGLRRLRLGANRLGPVAVRHLAESAHLGALRVLDLTNNPVGDKGAIALAKSPHLRNLVQLELMHCEVGDAGAQALLDSPLSAGLVQLNVYGDSRKNRVSDRVKARLKERMPGRVFV